MLAAADKAGWQPEGWHSHASGYFEVAFHDGDMAAAEAAVARYTNAEVGRRIGKGGWLRLRTPQLHLERGDADRAQRALDELGVLPATMTEMRTAIALEVALARRRPAEAAPHLAA